MSGDELRKAAQEMRRRAAAAPGGHWWADSSEDWGTIVAHAAHPDDLDGGGSVVAFFAYPGDPETHTYRGGFDAARHIASWGPDVALAMADLLDSLAQFDLDGEPVLEAAAAAARAYLGSPS